MRSSGITGESAQEFVEENGRGGGHVERFRAATDRDADDAVGVGKHLLGDARTLVSDHQQRAPRRRRGERSPAGGTGEHGETRGAQASVSECDSAARIGRRKLEPAAERTAFGFQGSTVPGSTSTPRAPSASAVRTSVPKLPGSCTASSASSTTSSSPRRRSASCQRGISATASTPCGVSVSASCASCPGSTRRTGTPARSARCSRLWRRAPCPQEWTQPPAVGYAAATPADPRRRARLQRESSLRSRGFCGGAGRAVASALA